MEVNGARLGWLLRAVELPVVLLVVWRPAHQFGPPLAAWSLAVAGAAWVGWLVLSFGAGAGRALWPLLCVIGAAGGIAAAVGVAGPDTGTSTAVALAVIVAVHAGVTLRPPVGGAVTAAGVLGVLVTLPVLGGRPVSGITYALLIVGGAAGGVARGLRAEQVRQGRLLLAEREEAQQARERAATLAERGRIARDMHDVLAHSLADLSIQLEVAGALLSDGGDRSGALPHVRRAHRITADGMEEVRRVVHALRSDSPALPDALMAMTGACRDARFDLRGSPRPLPPAVGLALLHTAREAMANAGKHAAGHPVTVELRFGEGRVALTIADRGETPGTGGAATAAGGVGGGYGLAGMHERLRLVGGELTAGPSGDGWRVHAEVPG